MNKISSHTNTWAIIKTILDGDVEYSRRQFERALQSYRDALTLLPAARRLPANSKKGSSQ